MTFPARYSQNYVWYVKDVLGKGATSIVYKGVHTTTGEPVAVKTLTSNGGLREFEVLKEIKHENIVKLLAIEEEETARVGANRAKPQVIITELCEGGCLYSILLHPENVHGLPDTEFLLVLKHLYQGMKYLREKDIIHRDLKPGNIMKCLNEDGSATYKLIDFGTARELTEEGGFKSLVGTEEYLAPDLYKKVFLGTSSFESITFHATVDLWSTGVTLYHVATGRLPFVPYGGRRNLDKTIMHYIISKKASGVISGIQKEFNGSINWSTELPVDSLLSPSLKRLVTPLLAGLMESDDTKIWNFEKFFNETENILSKKPAYVFYANSPALLRLYLPSNGGIKELQEELFLETRVVQKSRLLLYRSSLIEDDIIPATSQDCPLFLICKEDSKVFVVPMQKLPEQTSFTLPIKIEVDQRQAKLGCCQAFDVKRDIDKLILNGKLILALVEQLGSYIKQAFEELQKQSRWLNKRLRNLRRTAEIFEVSQKVNRYEQKTSAVEDLRKISEQFEAVNQAVSALFRKYHLEGYLDRLWRDPPETRSSASTQAHNLVQKLLTFRRHLVESDPTKTNGNLYMLGRKQFRIAQTRLFRILAIEVYPQYKSLCRMFEEYYKLVQVDLLKVGILKANLVDTDVVLDQFEDRLDRENESYNQYLESGPKYRTDEGPKISFDQRKLARELDHYHSTNGIEDILKENEKHMAMLRSTSETFSFYLEDDYSYSEVPRK